MRNELGPAKAANQGRHIVITGLPSAEIAPCDDKVQVQVQGPTVAPPIRNECGAETMYLHITPPSVTHTPTAQGLNRGSPMNSYADNPMLSLPPSHYLSLVRCPGGNNRAGSHGCPHSYHGIHTDGYRCLRVRDAQWQLAPDLTGAGRRDVAAERSHEHLPANKGEKHAVMRFLDDAT